MSWLEANMSRGISTPTGFQFKHALKEMVTEPLSHESLARTTRARDRHVLEERRSEDIHTTEAMAKKQLKNYLPSSFT